MGLGGEVNNIVMMINQLIGTAVGLTGKDRGLIKATKMLMTDKDDPSKKIDLGFVQISSINPAVVKALQDDAFIPVISPIGFGENRHRITILTLISWLEDCRNLKCRKISHDDQHTWRNEWGRVINRFICKGN
jgi:hypothetical protein